MKKLFILTILVLGFCWPQIQTARTINGASGEAFTAIVRTTIIIVILYGLARLIGLGLRIVATVLRVLARPFLGTPADRTPRTEDPTDSTQPSKDSDKSRSPEYA